MIQVLRDVTPCRWVSCSHRVDQSTSGFGGLDYITVEHEGITNGNHGEAAIGTLTLRRRIKSHLLFAGIIRSSPFSLR